MDIDADAQAAHSPIPQIHRLHRCQRQRYHMNFLASQGLLAHMDHYPIGKPQSSTNQLTLTEKGGGQDFRSRIPHHEADVGLARHRLSTAGQTL